MSGRRTPATVLLQLARAACRDLGAVDGTYTPIVMERYEHIGGERGVMLGFPAQTASGHGAICWTLRPTGTP